MVELEFSSSGCIFVYGINVVNIEQWEKYVIAVNLKVSESVG